MPLLAHDRGPAAGQRGRRSDQIDRRDARVLSLVAQRSGRVRHRHRDGRCGDGGVADQLNRDHVIRVGRGTIDEAIDVATRLNTTAVDAIVGIGGGRTLDVAKFAATRLGLPMLAVATNLSHDGIASPVSVLRHGTARRSYGVAAPAAVMVDLDFVERAPEHFLRSGVGDVVSNISAIADWRLSHELTGEPLDGVAAALASTAAEAVLAQPGKPAEPAFLRCLAEALILSGLAMSAAGTSRPCSGACHEISHALDHLYPGLGSHGEQVAIGALFATFVRGDASGYGTWQRCSSVTVCR